VSDENSMPYEKAIEETAKAVSNSVDLVREGGRAIGPAIGNIYGLLIGDKVSAARVRRLDEITRKTEQILRDRDVKERQELPEDIAIPLLEAAQGESREELQDVWARLLANAMDPERAHDVLPEFITTVSRLQPIDVLMLQIVSTASASKPVSEENAAERLKQSTDDRIEYRPAAARLSLARLEELKCTRRLPGSYYAMTDYGHELIVAVQP
jgi:hypothetical protein